MKFAAILLAASMASTSAFAPAAPLRTTTSLKAGDIKVTDAPAAKSAAEDLDKTLEVIMSHFEKAGGAEDGIDDSDDDTPYVPPTPPPAPVAAAPAPAAKSSTGIELWSVGYDDAAMLAYKAAGSKGDFEAFKTQYLADTSAMCGKKNPYTK